MSTGEWRGTLLKLKNRTLTRRITFCGGEATLRKDLYDLIRYATQEAGLSVSVVTNGFLLTDKMLREFERAGLDGLVISLNGIKKETHDTSRGIDGSFGKIMSMLPKLRHYDLKINLEAIIMGTNIDEIVYLAKLAKDNGLYGIHYQVLADVNAHYVLVNEKMPEMANDWYRENRFWIKDPAKTARVIQELIDMQKRGYPILNPTDQLRKMIRYYTAPQTVREIECLGGISTLYIDPYGEVRLCYGFESIGNIKEKNPLKLWRSPKARMIRRRIRRCDKMCRLLNNNY